MSQMSQIKRGRIHSAEEPAQQRIGLNKMGILRTDIKQRTNPGELVLSPFAGIGSEGVVSIEMGRRFLGFELKESYFRQACKFLAATEVKMNQAKLF